jgi:cytoskeletal protein CcmA (bactofilin family)
VSEKLTVIGPETRVAGEVRGDEDVVVQGRIEGRVALTAELTVEEGAILQADVEAKVVLISGVVVGNVSASDSVRLTPKARVVGDLTAPRVIIEAGAAYRGRLEMGEVALGEAKETRATARRVSDRDREAVIPAKAPPRVAPPSRVAAAPGAIAARVATASPPRAAAAASPPAPVAPARTPPAMPRPEAAASGGVASAPVWAKKKLHRRS